MTEATDDVESSRKLYQTLFKDSWQDIASLAVKLFGAAAILWPLAWCSAEETKARYGCVDIQEERP